MNMRKIPRITRQQRQEAMEKAKADRLERKGEPDPLGEWPDGPPEGDDEAMARYEAALRAFLESKGWNT